jgi:hypothetical protein
MRPKRNSSIRVKTMTGGKHTRTNTKTSGKRQMNSNMRRKRITRQKQMMKKIMLRVSKAHQTVIILMKMLKIVADINKDKSKTMNAYISEAQIMSCGGVDEQIADLIQPGHRTICSETVNLEINKNGRYTRTVKAKLDSCGSVSIAHEKLMNEIKSAGKYQLPPIRLRGIGGKTNLLNKVEILRIKQP